MIEKERTNVKTNLEKIKKEEKSNKPENKFITYIYIVIYIRIG